MEDLKTRENLVLHVLVVGFHHKKGCQVEYSYPPLLKNGSTESDECPQGWKYLPTLALPDGSHNYNEDTVYFHLPSLKDPNETVFGISCYRQISVEKVKNRTSDLTRDTVQKAVCVLSTVPLYGHIEVKMSLITLAYFEEGDFTKVSLLKDTYEHLNLCLSELKQLNGMSQFFDGLSAREFVLKFRHKTIVMFKLLLLEKRVIFYCSPVRSLCATILTLLSLYPGMLEHGLHHSACIKPSRPMSPMPDFCNIETDNGGNDLSINNCHSAYVVPNDSDDKQKSSPSLNKLNVTYSKPNNFVKLYEGGFEEEKSFDPSSVLDKYEYALEKDDSYEAVEDVTIPTNFTMLSELDISAFKMPLPIFTDGYLCLPYLSLPYMDLLTDPNVRGYIIGATNVLFKQKKHLGDVLIEIDTGKIETDDPELKRLLHLTTEDLRFADYVLKHVAEEKQDVFVDDVGWEGGDEWIRIQFKIYLLSLLRTSLLPENCRELDHFNSAFVSAWKDTNNYKSWAFNNLEEINCVNPGHLFAGQLSVADMKLRLSHTLHSSEGGRKFNQAMVTTGRAVGGALTQARGAFSNWWTNLTNATNADTSLITVLPSNNLPH